MLKLWEIDFFFDQDLLSVVPLWVKFPGLPVGYCSTESLSKDASVVGKPLYADDKFTAHFEKISYARILIEVDASQPLPDFVHIETPYGPLKKPIEYEWKPSFCNECIKYSHDSADCWFNEANIEKAEMMEEEPALPKKKKRRNRKKKAPVLSKCGMQLSLMM